ncbi:MULTISPECIES: twin-arginine translocase subunit TatC [Salinibaculum]|uniref:twin-arginine translocase subunit TatC n=1 Tax=Salinibaculum TaxID=2732368 RepID=UPI0030D290C2
MSEGDPDEGDEHPSGTDEDEQTPPPTGPEDDDDPETPDDERETAAGADDADEGDDADETATTAEASDESRTEEDDENDDSTGDADAGDDAGADEESRDGDTDEGTEGETTDDGADGDETTDEETDEDETGDDVATPGEDLTVPASGEPPTAPAEPLEPEAGAPDDQEMPLTAHIEEMVKRLGIVIVVMAIVSAVIFPLGDRLINFLWYSFLPGPPTECVQQIATAAEQAAGTAADGAGSDTAACPRLYHPLALVLARLKVASLGGFIIALPVFVYQTYLFMRPGLYPNERRYYLASVPTSLILAGIGVAFAYFLVLPIIFQYFLGYSQPVAEVAFGLSETFGLILLMLGMFAVIFQIPLFIMLAIMMGVTTRRWLKDRRLYFWFGFAGIAFLFSPDPTGMAPFIVALTMVLLFEGSLLLLRWTGR